jgi:hypothetical protein
MLKVRNPYFVIDLPDGWREHPKQGSLEALHFLQPELGQEFAVDIVGLRSCDDIETLRAELQKVVRQRQLEFLEAKKAISGPATESEMAGCLALQYGASFPGGALLQRLVTTSEPKDGVHIVLLVVLSESSEGATTESVGRKAERLMRTLTYLPGSD